MKIKKTIKGEVFTFYVEFIPNTMEGRVRLSRSDEWEKCLITDDFKWLILDNFYSPYISGVGRVLVKKLKLNKNISNDAKYYNNVKI